MKEKILSIKTLLIVIFIGGVFYVSFFAYQRSTQKDSLALNTNVVDFEEKIPSHFLPVRLKIPKIKVDAPFEYVGLTSDGAMDVPKGPASVAWFNLGPRPGDIGSSVVAGHSGYKDNRPAVFDNLYKLRKGDKIYVEDEKGSTLAFMVSKVQLYNPKADAGNVFSLNDDLAHLNLITCTGIWNKIDKTHASRLVVFTDMVVE